jgi:LysM repeat protein
MGIRPIIGVELLLDGQIMGRQKSERPEGISPFYADFDLLVPAAGPHAIIVRAVDTLGLIGQGALVSLVAEPTATSSFMAVQVQPGETLDHIAAAHGILPEMLQQLNQGVGAAPAAGTTIKVPAPRKDEPKQVPIGPAAPGGSAPVQIPNVPMMQIASDRGIGLLPIGPFIPEPFAGGIGPPAAPTDLQVEAKGCKVTLRWQDNADDEDNYYVYLVPAVFHGFETPTATLKPSPKTGPTWYEFQPSIGGALSFWVEAANSYGSQPSNVVWAYVPFAAGCPATAANSLTITFLDVTVNGNADKAYCYVSFENTPEQRLPYEEFIALQGGKSQASDIASFGIAVPKDRIIDLSGECWGWSGNALSKIGDFRAALAPETWNGQRQTLTGTNLQIGVSVSPYPETLADKYGSTDPTLTVPYDVTFEVPPGDQGGKTYHRPFGILRWKWDGDPKLIDGFEIFLNGKPYDSVKADSWGSSAQLPNECGEPPRWQVAARAGTVTSNLSAPFVYALPKCQTVLRVRFDQIILDETDDGWPGDYCDNLEAYFKISVRDATRSFWDTNFAMPLRCGTYKFKDITGGPFAQLYAPEPNAITIPVSPGEDLGAIWIEAKFWDSDTGAGSSDDLFASFAEHPLGAYVPQLGQRWTCSGTSLGCSSGPDWECAIHGQTGRSIFDEAKSSLVYTYSVYPNNCKDIPPETGF